MTFIIAISGISGAGKTTLAKRLSSVLEATAIFWDDFDSISQGPDDYVKWYYSSKDYNDWKYDDLAEVLRKLKNKEAVLCPATKQMLYPTSYLIFDAPLGYSHQATGQFIDYLICLDTPLDIALARRLLRDYSPHSDSSNILTELNHYLLNSRPLFFLPTEHKKTSDLIIDGSLSIENQVLLILKNLPKA